MHAIKSFLLFLTHDSSSLFSFLILSQPAPLIIHALKKPKQPPMISIKVFDNAKVKSRQIFHLFLSICGRGFLICGVCELDCGLWVVMEVVGCGGGCGLWRFWVVLWVCGLCLMVAMGCFTRWQWVVVGLFGLVVVGGGSVL